MSLDEPVRHRWAMRTLSVCVGLIFALGIVMIFNTSSAEVLDMRLTLGTHHALIRQILYACLGTLSACTVAIFGYRNLLKISVPLLIAGTVMLLLTLIPGIGVQANGAKRWIGIAGLTFQPSEFVKQIIPLYFIHRVLEMDPMGRGRITPKQFFQTVAVVLVPIVLIVLEPNNGTVGVIAVTLIATFIAVQVPSRYWAIPMAVAMLVAGITAYNMPYVAARLRVYANPELDILGRGHQPHQAKIAAGSGQLFGKGPGHSIQKLSYLPEAQNDYIAAIYGEEFGFMGIFALIALYTTVAYCGFHIASDAADRGGCFLAAALTFLISLQAFLNLGVVSGLLPSTGLNLPFFSQGGTSLMANITAIGVLFDINRER